MHLDNLTLRLALPLLASRTKPVPRLVRDVMLALQCDPVLGRRNLSMVDESGSTLRGATSGLHQVISIPWVTGNTLKADSQEIRNNPSRYP